MTYQTNHLNLPILSFLGALCARSLSAIALAKEDGMKKRNEPKMWAKRPCFVIIHPGPKGHPHIFLQNKAKSSNHEKTKRTQINVGEASTRLSLSTLSAVEVPKSVLHYIEITKQSQNIAFPIKYQGLPKKQTQILCNQ
jgi:hypothetical protein